MYVSVLSMFTDFSERAQPTILRARRDATHGHRKLVKVLKREMDAVVDTRKRAGALLRSKLQSAGEPALTCEWTRRQGTAHINGHGAERAVCKCRLT
ncbi:hypothetical protein EVAR_10116_1 [Eumeta japonica]|uniref:Uncharacterized protein n=1 Tax=Eumeta variegata TaxID=151549 RepID=A0A4C1UC30_EUMVA|nr:hypothetical protein EVAR_10116_1 [Eumeta japonica]